MVERGGGGAATCAGTAGEGGEADVWGSGGAGDGDVAGECGEVTTGAGGDGQGKAAYHSHSTCLFLVILEEFLC